MCVESSEWMKVGSRRPSASTLLGFLAVSGHTVRTQPGHSLAPRHPYPDGLLHVCLCPHSLVGVHTAAESEALEPALSAGWI